MNVSTKRPARANAIPRANRKLIGAAIAAALAAASPVPAFAGFEGWPQAPCDGHGSCYHNGMIYTDFSFVGVVMTENPDGSGDSVINYDYFNAATGDWPLLSPGEETGYNYVVGTDEYGYPITQWQRGFSTGNYALESGKTISMQLTSSGSGGRINNLADGVNPMDAVNKRQLDWVAANASGSDPLAVKYTDGHRNTVSVGGRVANIADGVAGNDAASVNQVNSVTIVAQDGVNRAVLAQNTATTAKSTADKGVADAATALQVGAEGRTLARGAQGTADTARSEAATAQGRADKGVADAGAALTAAQTTQTALTNLSKVALTYTDATKAAVNVNAQVKGVTAGTAGTDAVNVTQLNAVNTTAVNARTQADKGVADAAAAQTSANTANTAVTNLGNVAVKYTDASKAAVNINAQVKGVTAGTAATDAVNVTQLNAVGAVATQAKTQADLGVTNAVTAQARADKGVADAAAAQTSANTANTAITSLSKVALTYTDATKAAVNVNAQVKGVTAGTAATDAVNVTQLDAVNTTAVNARTQADKGVANAATAQARADNAYVRADLGITNAARAHLQADKGVADAAAAQTSANTANTAVTNLGNVAVKYTDASKAAVNVNAQVKGVTAGTAATDAVNVTQLDAVSTTAVNARTQADKGVANAATAQARADRVGVDLTALDARAVQFGAAGVIEAKGSRVANLGDGVNATDAVNKRQLDALAGEVGGIGGDALQFDGTTYNAIRDGNATRISGVAEGVGDNDAANMAQLNAVHATATKGVANAAAAQATADGIGGYVVATPGAAGNVAANAGPEGAVALGYGTTAGSNHVAVGQGAVSIEAAEPGSRGAAVGFNARAHGNATAIGGESSAADSAIAVGRSAEADLRGSALGANSYATDGAVALGHGSRAIEANTVSVGTAEVQRRIVNVADGVAASDAVTMRQHGDLTGEVIQIRDSALRFNGAAFSARRDGYATRITGVANGTEASDAVNRGQLDGVEGQAKAAQQTADQVGTDLAALDARAVQFGADGAIQGKGARLANIADGVEATDAVNRRQLDALAGEVGGIAGDALKFDGTTYNATRSGVATRISGVADGTAAGDAVNRGQLDGVEGQAKTAQQTADQVGTDLAALDARAVQFTGPNGAITAKGARLVDLADGVDAGDAVNRRQLDGVEGQAKAAQQTADQVGTDLAALDARAVQFGADGAIQGKGARLANLADGVEATDAVNKRQLDALAGEVGGIAGDALKFDGTTYNATRSGIATRISGVADGKAAGDAVNKGQLDGVAGQVEALDGLAVKYTDASRSGVVFGNPQGGAVRLSNVADGVDGTDAVNKRQLDSLAGEVGGIAGDALLFDGQAYNATRGGQSTRITGVAAAITGSDAVNFDQVSALTAVFGGGVSWSNGVLTNPSYNIGGGNFRNVGDALAAVDGKLANLENRVGGVETSPALNRPVLYDDSTQDAVTLEGVNGTRISNVQAGVNGMDAANVDQVRQGISESRTYTDKRAQETLRDSKAYTDSRVDDMWRGVEDIAAQVDSRFRQTDKRINRQSAMTSAMVQMATNAAGSRSERGRIGAGLGWSSGERALSIGYSRAIGERGSFSIGGALSGGESSAGVGFGFDL